MRISVSEEPVRDALTSHRDTQPAEALVERRRDFMNLGGGREGRRFHSNSR